MICGVGGFDRDVVVGFVMFVVGMNGGIWFVLVGEFIIFGGGGV